MAAKLDCHDCPVADEGAWLPLHMRTVKHVDPVEPEPVAPGDESGEDSAKHLYSSDDDGGSKSKRTSDDIFTTNPMNEDALMAGSSMEMKLDSVITRLVRIEGRINNLAKHANAHHLADQEFRKAMTVEVQGIARRQEVIEDR